MDSGKVLSSLPFTNDTPESMMTSGVKWLDSNSLVIWGSDLLIADIKAKSKIRASTLLGSQFGITLMGEVTHVSFNESWVAFATTDYGLACINRETSVISYTYTEAEIISLCIVGEQVIFLTKLGNLLQTNTDLKPPIKLREGIKQIDYHPSYGLLGWDHDSIFAFSEKVQ